MKSIVPYLSLMASVRLTFGLLPLLLLASGCDGYLPFFGGPRATVSLRVERIGFTPGGFFVGDTMRLVAYGIDDAGRFTEAVSPRWQSNDTAVATISSKGLVSAKRHGRVTLIATSGSSLRASIDVTVISARCTANLAAQATFRDSVLSGEITTEACVLTFGHARGWKFQVTEPTVFAWEVRQSYPSIALQVNDSQFAPVISDSEAGSPAAPHRLRWTLMPGEYTGWVSIAGPPVTGAFNTRIRTVTACERASPGTTLYIGETVTGRLTDTSCVLKSGSPAETFVLALSEQKLVAVEVRSTAFVPTVERSWNQARAVEWLSAMRSDSIRHVTLVRAGPVTSTFYLHASEGDLRLGAFEVKAHAMQTCEEGVYTGLLARDTMVLGTLDLNDCVDFSAMPALSDQWVLDLAQHDTIIATLTDSSGSAYASFSRTGGVEIPAVFSYRTGFSGTERFALTAGRYYVRVRSGRGTDSYSLRLERQQ